MSIKQVSLEQIRGKDGRMDMQAELAHREGELAAEVIRAQGVEGGLQGQITAEVGRATGAEGALDTKIDQEIQDRGAAITAEAAARAAAILVVQNDVNLNESDGDTDRAAIRSEFAAADTSLVAGLKGDVHVDYDTLGKLEDKIQDEESRIDSILSASTADKDSFAEIVTLINSVDTENDTAFAGYVTSNNAALVQDRADRLAGDDALQLEIDAEETRALAAESGLTAALGQEVQDRVADVNAEEQRALAAEGVLSSSITSLTTSMDNKFTSIEQGEQSIAKGDYLHVNGLFLKKEVVMPAGGLRIIKADFYVNGVRMEECDANDFTVGGGFSQNSHGDFMVAEDGGVLFVFLKEEYNGMDFDSVLSTLQGPN
jgi:hypothetical protein